MNQKNVKILVAMHKEYRKPEDELYLPIHVGKAISDVNLDIQGDNVGENISDKNSNYCELTGIYWAWKNLDAEYIGLSHYRRYFSVKKTGEKFDRIMTGKQVESILENVDVILPQKRNYYIETNESQYLHAHHKEGWDAMCQIIKDDYSGYIPALEAMCKSTKGHRFNMFVMKKELFNMYCEWLFDVLFKVEKQIDISGYDKNEARVFGFLSERMLDVWLNTNRISYVEVPVLYMEHQNWMKKGSAFLKRKLAGGKL